MDEHEQQRIKNKVDDIEKFIRGIKKEIYSTMINARNLGVLGILIGCASLGVSAFMAVRLWGE
jgi:tetrahydromethanopterin S-methyltransferase subunit G